MANVGTAAGGRHNRGAARQPQLKPRVDLATVLGIFGAFLVIGTAMVLGGSPESFVDLPAILIVIFGTLLVTIVSFSLEEVWRGLSVIRRAAIYHSLAPSVAATQILYLADMARRRGKLSLQGDVKKFRQNSFLFNAINMVVDGLPAEQVEKILIAEVDATRHRHLSTAGVLRRAGEVAPAMGLIGTLVGLVQMLGNLDDPSSIGPSMAVALLTTFYGAVLANMVFNPLAGKLERNADAEAAVNHIYTLGASSICRQDNPRRLEIMLNSGLPPGERVAYFNS